MQTSGDCIPTNDADFDKWANNFITYVKSKTVDFKEPEWPDIPYEHVNELIEAYDEWKAAYERTLVPHTPGATAAKNEKRDKLKKLIREFVKRYIHFSPVTKEDRVNVDIPEHDTTRTGHFEVDEHVDFVFKPSNQREVEIDFWVKGSSNKAKPKGYDGAVLIHCARAAGEPAPASHDDLTLHIMASRTAKKPTSFWLEFCFAKLHHFFSMRVNSCSFALRNYQLSATRIASGQRQNCLCCSCLAKCPRYSWRMERHSKRNNPVGVVYMSADVKRIV